MERRPAAISAGDVAGYARMKEVYEARTFQVDCPHGVGKIAENICS